MAFKTELERTGDVSPKSHQLSMSEMASTRFRCDSFETPIRQFLSVHFPHRDLKLESTFPIEDYKGVTFVDERSKLSRCDFFRRPKMEGSLIDESVRDLAVG